MRLEVQFRSYVLSGLEAPGLASSTHTQKHKNSQICCHMPEIQVSERLSQEHLKSEARLGDLVSSCLTNMGRVTEKHIHHQLLSSVDMHTCKNHTQVCVHTTHSQKEANKKLHSLSEDIQNSIFH